MNPKHQQWLRRVESYVEKPWYPALLGFLAFIDYFIILIPTDGLLITSIMAAPRRWLSIGIAVSIGTTLGAAAFAITVHHLGNPFIDWLTPGIREHALWRASDGWVDKHGLWAMFGIAAMPIFQHPAIAIAALAQMPLTKMILAVFAGRSLKYFAFSWLSSHAPHYLFKFKSVRKEVETVEPDLT